MKLATLALAALSLATCAQQSRLDDTQWTIAAVNGEPVRTALPVEIRFDRGRVTGTAGCNSFGGSYRVDGDRLNTSRIISTKMACAGPGMEVEHTLFAIIANPARIRLDGRTLTLANAQGSATFFGLR
ncbi:MAG: META domain-containing protein [Sphingomonas sp.]|uniref:META domain-containing protein n=1 Tax=Sphingomonas sp. TaxID=28214 RepID=UPI003F7E3651